MTPSDFVFNTVYKGAIAKGANERRAKDAAVSALQKFKRSDFKKINDLVSGSIKEALKK